MLFPRTRAEIKRVTLNRMARSEGAANTQVADVAAERAIRLAHALVENVGNVLEGKREPFDQDDLECVRRVAVAVGASEQVLNVHILVEMYCL